MQTGLPRFLSLGLLLALCLCAHAQDLLAQLHDLDDQVRLRAVQSLGYAKNADAVAPLLTLLEHDNPLLRAAAVEALGRIGDRQATPAILLRLRDEFALVQMQAVAALGALKDPRGADALRQIAATPRADFRTQAIIGLGAMGEPNGIRLLCKLITDPNTEVRVAAREGLQAVTDPQALPVLEDALASDSMEVRILVLRQLEQIDGADTLPLLLRGARDSNPTVRVEAARLLSTVEDARAGVVLAALLRDAQPAVRLAASGALGVNAPADAVPVLLDWLDGPDTAHRQAALRALPLYADSRILPALAKLTGHTDPSVRLTAACALAARGDTRAVTPLLTILEQPDFANQQQAITALGMCRDARVLVALQDALTDPALRGPAILALRRQGPMAVDLLKRQARGMGTLAERLVAYEALMQLGDPRATDVFVSALNGTDRALISQVLQLIIRGRRRGEDYQVRDVLFGVRPPIAFVLPSSSLVRSWLADPRVIDVVLPLLRDGRANTSQVIAALRNLGPDVDGRIVKALAPYATGTDLNLRRAALQTISEVGFDRDGQATRLLMAALNDGNPTISQMGYQGLLHQANLTDPQPLLAFFARETDWRRRVWALEILGRNGDNRAIDPLLQLFVSEKYGPAGIRERAALALGLIGDARAVPMLCETLNDPAEWVRSAAAWSLGEIGDTRAITPLYIRAQADEPRFQGRAYRALGQLGDPTGWEQLLPILDGGDAMARELALGGLMEVRRPDTVPPLCRGLGSTTQAYMNHIFPALGASGDRRAILPLRRYAQQYGQTIWVSQALVRLHDRATIERLVNLLRGGTDPPRSYEPLLALAETDDPRVPVVAAIYLTDGDPVVCALAARLFIRRGDRRGVPVALALLNDDQGDVLAQDIIRQSLVALEDPAALGGIADAPLCAKLIRRFQDGAIPQRVEAVALLGVVGTTDAVEPLVLALHDSHARVREAAAHSLGQQGERKAVDALTAALGDDASRVREQAVYSLGSLGNHTAISALIELLRRERTTPVITAALLSLRQLTGDNPGTDAAAWIAWFDRKKKSGKSSMYGTSRYGM